MGILRNLLLICILSATIPAAAQEAMLQKVSFVPQWLPQSQFAGYYTAQEKGIYRKYGIELNLLTGGPSQPSAKLLEEGRVDFATMFLSTGIKKRAEGLKLVNIGQIVQRSSLMLVARRSSGINTPYDIDGKKVGLWGDEFRVQPLAFFKQYNLHVHIVPQGNTMNLFLMGGVDLASAMWYNEYHTILNSGLDPNELTVFFFFSYGMDIPEDGIYCLEDTYRNDPDLCRRFVKASIEGWRYAFDHPVEALDIVMKYVNERNLATDRCHQKWMLERMRDVILTVPAEMSAGKPGIRDSRWGGPNATVPMGFLSPDAYDSTVKQLLDYGLIAHSPNYSDFYMDCVNPDAN